MPTILTKKSDTPGSIPATANLTNAAGGAELAVNTADKRLFTINSTSQVVELGTNPSSITCADGSFTVARIGSGTVTQLTSTSATITTLTATSATVTNLTATSLVISNLSVASMNITTLTSASATITNLVNTSASITTLTNNPTFGAGTANGVLYLNGSKVATSGSALTFDGTTLGVNTGVVAGTALSLTGNYVASGSVAFINFQRVGGAVAGTLGYDDANIAIRFGTTTNHSTIFLQNNSEAMRLTSTGLGIGTSSPGTKLDVVGTVQSNGAFSINGTATGSASKVWFGSDGASGGFINVPTSQPLNIYQNNATLVAQFSASGNLGLGVTPSAWTSSYSVLQFGVGASLATYKSSVLDELFLSANAFENTSGNWTYIGSAATSQYWQAAGKHIWRTAASGTAGNTISFTQAMTLSAAGGLSVGTTSDAGAGNISCGSQKDFRIAANSFQRVAHGDAGGGFGGGYNLYIDSTTAKYDSTGAIAGYYYQNGGVVSFFTGGSAAAGTTATERARITDGGVFCFGTTNVDPANANVAGASIGNVTGLGIFSRDAGAGLVVNRRTDDGVLVSFSQAGTEEGTISVSGNTVSYNAFAGSHWSQLQDGSKPDILRGTVMESINELCVWPDEENERLPKSKISDTAGSKKVYGVFMAWDNDWTTTNDMYVTAVGAFICRVNGSVTVQEGDLLESNGDGTARVQADDIIRSSTIGKVTSTVKTHEYDDGSYCVPTVLYCG